MEKVAVVTGGGSGLGYSLSRFLLQKGYKVYIVGRQAKKLEEASNSFEAEFGKQVPIFGGDVSDEFFVKSVFDTIADKGESVDVLFNCAGQGQFGPAENNTNAMIEKAFAGSLTGLILMSSHALKAMKSKGGLIVNIMSTAALKGNPNESVYCAAKWGARGFTEAIKAATKGSNVKVIGVYPGGMKTPFWNPDAGMMPDTSKFMDPDEVASLIVDSIDERNTLSVSDITIDRK